MNLFQLIGSIFKPAAELIDNIHTSEEEKLVQKGAMLNTQVKLLEYALEYEQEQLKAKTEIIVAEAKSESWITRNWRPVTMLSFVASILGYWFGLTPDTIPPEAVDSMFTLVQIGLGGYVVGRSAEKVVPPIIAALKGKEQT
jgi:Holin of 3TMs, for gene-transfer release